MRRRFGITVYILVFVYVILFFSWSILLFFDKGGADCVTYFDKEARYQLIYVGGMCFLYDSFFHLCKMNLKNHLKYYSFYDGYVYAICENTSGASVEDADRNTFPRENYHRLNTITGEMKKYERIDEIDSNIQAKYQRENMIDLTQEMGTFYKWFSDFIPSFMRKR